MVDWADSEDPQYWTVVPITEAEERSLPQEGNPVSETQLMALAPGRRCLRRNYPKNEAPRVFWSTGMVIGPHD